MCVREVTRRRPLRGSLCHTYRGTRRVAVAGLANNGVARLDSVTGNPREDDISYISDPPPRLFALYPMPIKGDELRLCFAPVAAGRLCLEAVLMWP